MNNGQAPAGGAIGTNGEFYAGGQFLPSTQLPKRNQPKAKRFTGPKRELIAPYEWAECPDGMRSIYSAVMGIYGEMRNGTMVRCEAGCAYYGETITLAGVTLGSVDSLIARYNNGERWINA